MAATGGESRDVAAISARGCVKRIHTIVGLGIHITVERCESLDAVDVSIPSSPMHGCLTCCERQKMEQLRKANRSRGGGGTFVLQKPKSTSPSHQRVTEPAKGGAKWRVHEKVLTPPLSK